jgi:hypothetical protein
VYGGEFEDENFTLQHTRGALSMANSGVTLLSHCCRTVVTLSLHCYHTFSTLLLHYCYKVVTPQVPTAMDSNSSSASRPSPSSMVSM